jgi:hypothetical protein
MPKTKTATEKDMFGYPVKNRISRYERLLTQIDKETFSNRLERFKFVDGMAGDIGLAGSFEAVFVFREAGWAYINGEFISTILLAQAFIERLLTDFLIEKGLEGEAKHGVQAIIKYSRKHELISEFLLNNIDRLRQIRNPFVHSKSFDHPFTLGKRAVFEQTSPNKILENDAKEALSLMYTILLTRL